MSMVRKLAIIVVVLALAALIIIQRQLRGPRNETVVERAQTKRSSRAITAPKFIKRASGTMAETASGEASNTEVPEAQAASIPQEVPTAQSNDDEIRGFLAWLSSLDRENASEETEIGDLDLEDNEDGIDYNQEISLINSVIWEQWKKGYETYDVERYMSAIWEDDFFYTSDTGTPDDPSDDIILRGGQREREAAARVFSKYRDIELSISPRSDVEFLSDTIAMVEYDYEIKFSQTPTPESRFEAIYASGNMDIILERRRNSGGIDEWRILEWYDYATPKQ